MKPTIPISGHYGAGDYVVDASIGGISGLSTAPAPAMEAKQGYAGQIYDLVRLDVSATPASVNENATCQLEASAVCDDATMLDLDESEVGWSVESGPLVSVSSSGLATAGIVYEDTGAVVRGTHLASRWEWSGAPLFLVEYQLSRGQLNERH